MSNQMRPKRQKWRIDWKNENPWLARVFVIFLWMVIDDFRRLFADTKPRENRFQQIVGGDLTGDQAQLEKRFPNIGR